MHRYQVKEGDTLLSITLKRLGDGRRVNEIMEINNLTQAKLNPGEILELPFYVHVVKRGDKLWDIALNLGNVELIDEIMALNDLKSHSLMIGQELKLPYAPKTGNVYVVEVGDSLWDIACQAYGDGNRYHEIIRLNNLDNDTIFPGQLLEMPPYESIKSIFYSIIIFNLF